MTNIFKDPDINSYQMSRPKLTVAYLENMKQHLKSQYPEADDAEIETFVKDIVVKRIQRPKVDVLLHPRYGVTERKELDLLDYTSSLDKVIITPAGVVYMPPSKKRSILSEVLDESVKLRNQYKHVQLESAATGDTVGEQIAKLLQASAKIFNNSIPGAMGTIYSFLYDLPGYNAITSTGRQCVKTGYSHTERMLASNVYVTDVDDVINYCVQLIRVCPHNRVGDVIGKYGITIPSVDLMTTFFMDCLKYYIPAETCELALRKYLSTLSDIERTYIFYAYGYRNLLIHNEKMMRDFLSRFFSRQVAIDPTWDPKAIDDVESDLLAMAMSLNFDVINREPKLEEAIVNNPDGVRKLLGICYHMMECINGWSDLLTTFFMVDADIPRMWEHPNMVRRCVLVSDTDSVIFSTDEIVKWYSPNERFTQDAYDINAFSVFMVSQTLEHLFARMTTGMGVEGDDRKRIKMKNEFYYPIFIRTALAKHYAGAIFIQEGKILPKPKMDIKGVNFRGSDLPSQTSDAFEGFVKWVLDELTTHSTISSSAVIGKIAEHELEIYNSLMQGEKIYLPTKGIRLENEYKDAMVSDYFYYLLWNEVFADKFGEFVLPNKGFVVPVLGNGAAVNIPDWREKLKAFDPGMEARLTAFQEKHPKKKITRIIVPPTVKEIPEIFRMITDARSIIFKNGRPFYLLSRSLTISIDDKHGKFIASDFIDMGSDSLHLQH